MLLMQAQEPASDFVVWFAPGGGIETGENPQSCLRREIEEETGVVLGNIGPLIWQRHHIFEWDGQMLSQDEDFYLVPIDEFEPDWSANPSKPELVAFRQFRWWSPAEIAASQDVFAPRLLAQHLQTLIEHGAPETPVDVGV
jgi:8-oxo-dGTP pyrophosphatase MutT (NUDIX family)